MPTIKIPSVNNTKYNPVKEKPILHAALQKYLQNHALYTKKESLKILKAIDDNCFEIGKDDFPKIVRCHFPGKKFVDIRPRIQSSFIEYWECCRKTYFV